MFERLNQAGCRLSEIVADIAGHPLAQLGLLLGCVAWFRMGLPVEILTAALSILAITLTQMVLNRQDNRELEAHRRDVALHAKLDELVLASGEARDEIAGIEELEEDEIDALRPTALQKGTARKVRVTEPLKLVSKSAGSNRKSS